MNKRVSENGQPCSELIGLPGSAREPEVISSEWNERLGRIAKVVLQLH